MRGAFWSPNADENPFYNFVKVFVPYCTSDIHQGNRDASEESGNFYFTGKRNTAELVEMLRFEYNIDSAKKVILSGASAGGKGAAGNCNSMGDQLKASVRKRNPRFSRKNFCPVSEHCSRRSIRMLTFDVFRKRRDGFLCLYTVPKVVTISSGKGIRPNCGIGKLSRNV